MQTTHTIHLQDARGLPTLDDNSVDLVVTSPPYPMIEMWDDLFSNINPSIKHDIETNNQWDAYEKMHTILNDVWKHIPRVLKENGIVCINIGDATRTIGSQFTRFPNHETITNTLTNHGLQPLTNIIWHKPTNSPSKYMGSGMRPPNAYVTLEHEHILIFRNGTQPRQRTAMEQRAKSAYFIEERNKWFSDLWTNITGKQQAFTTKTQPRNKTAAYPLEIPHRLINMFSVYEDTVLDPFWGTGTTTLAAIYNARNSIGFEIEDELFTEFTNSLQNIKRKSKVFTHNRLHSHHEHVMNMESYQNAPKMKHYDTRTMRTQQTNMELYVLTAVTITSESRINCQHTRYTDWNDSKSMLNVKNNSLSEY